MTSTFLAFCRVPWNNLLDFFRITGVVLGLLILVSCGERDGREGSWSHFLGLVDTVTVRDTILKVDTLIVDREIILRDTVLIEKEVIKRVEVPAEIPEEYKRALEIVRAEDAAITATDATVFSGVDSLDVRIFLNENAREIISEQRVRDKFELILRGYGIPVSNLDSVSLFTKLLGFNLWGSRFISLSMEVAYNDMEVGYSNVRMYVYTTQLRFDEVVIFYRDGKPYRRSAVLWDGGGSYGYAGKQVIEDVLLDNIKERAERVANLYLSANPR